MARLASHIIFFLAVANVSVAGSPRDVGAAAPLAQCESSSYLFCCGLGVPCDCSEGATSPGQCADASYAFCCSVGTPCDCSGPPLNSSTKESAIAGPLSTEVAVAPTQCKSSSYLFCCGLGVPCDCSVGTTSPGQCEEASYAFCCSVGTPCDCSAPPMNVTV
uniref:Uncharacterized protein n=1 Tax=Noctiluca scintillans TaxID=2966 RepID=A0A7S1B1X4_NOCSC|mmetsp:Transcript_917/g.2606  ORF Transcript_917/g.2606 Transcript_917/m.2606 type:complete len:162 (+) Transcript_917:83-568(+)